MNPLQENDRTRNHAALIEAITANTNLNAQEAERALTFSLTSYDHLNADLKAAKRTAESKAREAAENAADALAVFSPGTFGAFVIGAGAARFGEAQAPRLPKSITLSLLRT